jgi:hypothetical protein
MSLAARLEPFPLRDYSRPINSARTDAEPVSAIDRLQTRPMKSGGWRSTSGPWWGRGRGRL